MVFSWISAKFTVASILLSLCGASTGTGLAETRECQFTLTDDSGTFQTPGFPDKYPNNIECIWNIQVKPGRFVLLSFDLFELESYKGKCIDLVEVKDGSRSTDQLLGSFCETSLPPKVITSSANSLRVWFYSDRTEAYQGFNASYTSQWEKGCGGLVSKNSGSISSPRFPDYLYPNSMQCVWIITVPRGKFIRLEFSDFEVEYNCDSDNDCRCVDRLELWDGPEFNETKLERFCDSFQPVVVSISNRMRLRFITNEEGRFKGFALSYTTSLTPGCGGDFAGKNGVITSPNYPVSFPAFSDCVWRIRAPADRYISFRFVEFTGINGTNSECSVDSVEVRAGYSRKARIIERYCIQNFPPIIVTNGHELYIHFRARSEAKGTSQFYRRFRGIYLTHSTDCNESIGLQDGRVKNSQLSASSFFTLQLGQGQLYMTPQYGRIGSAYSWCSQIQVLNKIVGEYLQIDLLNLTEVTAIATQGYQLPSISYWGYVSRYKVQYNYEGNRWITYNTENSTRLGFTEFSGSTNINNIKKNTLEPSILAKKIRILPTRYHSSPVRHMCLRAELYGCTHDLGCGSIISFEKPGKISVRGSDQQPKKCRWLSTPSTLASSNDVISFHFTYFDVPCRHGYVTLHDRNGGKKKTFCGADPPPVTSLPASSQITLGIKLEIGASVWGFDLKYKTESLGCGRLMQVSRVSTLTSPSYPLSYGNNQHCTWILTAHPGSKIAVTFFEFDLQPSSDKHCDDYVQIQDGRQDTSTVLWRYCGQYVPVQVTSTFNNLRITFHSDNTTTAKGFLLQYSVVPPKQRQTTPHQSEQTENIESSTHVATARPLKNIGHSTAVSSCLIQISLLVVLIHPFFCK